MTRVGRNTARWRMLCRTLKVSRAPWCFCGEEIDLTLSGRHPRGWTLDHIKPLAERPDLAEVESNLRPAHNECNVKRGMNMDVQVINSKNWG